MNKFENPSIRKVGFPELECNLCKVKNTPGVKYCGVHICIDCIKELNNKARKEQ